MTIKITVKQSKDVETHTRANVKFYSFDKQYLAIIYNNRSHGYYRLSTVLAIEEVA